MYRTHILKVNRLVRICYIKDKNNSVTSLPLACRGQYLPFQNSEIVDCFQAADNPVSHCVYCVILCLTSHYHLQYQPAQANLWPLYWYSIVAFRHNKLTHPGQMDIRCWLLKDMAQAFCSVIYANV